MPRYVDLDKLPQVGLWRDPEDHGAMVELRDVIQALRQAEAQTGEVAPVVHGYWILRGADKQGLGGVWVCSACGGCEPCKKNRCPNCAAKMDGGVNNNAL